MFPKKRMLKITSLQQAIVLPDPTNIITIKYFIMLHFQIRNINFPHISFFDLYHPNITISKYSNNNNNMKRVMPRVRNLVVQILLFFRRLGTKK